MPDITYDDALSKELTSITQKDKVDCILANPPFGGNVSDGMETNFPKNYRTKESADLFLILMIQYLKNNGRAGIVLPDGSLTGDGVKARIREKLLTDCNLHTIIRLPNSVFQPYASVSTNLLFFTKGTPTKEIWYYEHKLPKGQKAYSKTKPIKVNEFLALKEWWENRKENTQAWKVNIQTIRDNGFNLDIKNPYREVKEFISPTEVFTKQRKIHNLLTKQVQLILDELKLLENKSDYFDILLNNFDIFISNIENIKYLKQFILKCAIDGKLTASWRKQNSNIETAQILLGKIKSQKEQLVKNKEIRKQKPLPVIKEDEISFNIPDNWMWCRLGDFGVCQTGTTPSTMNKDNFGNDIPFIKPGDISLNAINYENEGLSLKGLSEGRLIKNNSLLMVCIGGSIGKSFYIDKDVSCNQQINTLTPLAEINSVFLQYFVQSDYFQQAIWDKASGGATPMVNRGKWETILLPLPPLKEQFIILEKIENLFKICDELEEQINSSKINSQTLMQAVLKEAFEK